MHSSPVTASAASGPDGRSRLIVQNALLLTLKPGEAPFTGYLIVGADGRITAIGPGDPPPEASADRILDVAGRFVAPGFVSAHSHLFQSPLRGLGADCTLFGWLDAINRLCAHATPDDIYWFCLHGSLDFLRSGITTAYDFTYSGDLGGGQRSIGIGETAAGSSVNQEPYEEAQIHAKLDAGLRFIDSISIVPLGTEEEIEQRIQRVLAYAQQFSAHPLFLKMAISGWVQRASGIESAHREVRFMRKYGLMNQAHFLESPERVPEQQAKFAWYRDAGALGPDFIFGHFIHTTPQIIRETAESGACMCWQPTSNGRLGSGTADIPTLRKAGIKIGIGLDDQSCCDLSDPFQNLRMALYSIRAKYQDASILSAAEVLHYHTLGSARILGIADQVGSLEVGKFADFLVVDPRQPDTGPVHDALATYVLACGLRNLQQVYVAGELVAEGCTLVGRDESAVRREVDTRMARMQAARTATILTVNLN
jgi:cytosine/adenosine deaminase-related metal-dependent hydrolase